MSIGNIDYTSVNNGSITVDPSQPAPNITVNITDDTYFEDDETFFVNFTGCSLRCVVPSANDTVEVTIQNDDGK